jgi:hypothetical protein
MVLMPPQSPRRMYFWMTTIMTESPSLEHPQALVFIFKMLQATNWNDLMVETLESIEDAIIKGGGSTMVTTPNITKKLKLLIKYAQFMTSLAPNTTLHDVKTAVAQHNMMAQTTLAGTGATNHTTMATNSTTPEKNTFPNWTFFW